MTDKALTVTAQKVRDAAAKCSTANTVLRSMFPEAFEPEKVEVDFRKATGCRTILSYSQTKNIHPKFHDCLIVATEDGKGIKLCSDCADWDVVRSDDGTIKLFPTPKK